jgi:hypothetical protein
MAADAGLLGEVLTLGSATWAWAALEPATVSSVTLAAATAHSATAKVAITAPGRARILSQLQLIDSENRANHFGSAR